MKNKRVGILGKTGWIGSRVYNCLMLQEGITPIFMSRSLLEQGDKYMRDFVDASDTVINCIGKTGNPNVDELEDKDVRPLSRESNTEIPIRITEHCKKLGKPIIHVSSGCVFDGLNKGKPWSESDLPNFRGSRYSNDKLDGEQEVMKYEKSFILRIRMPFNHIRENKNLLYKIEKYPSIVTGKNSITDVDEFINFTVELSKHSLRDEDQQYGVYHCVHPQPICNSEIVNMMSYEMFISRKTYLTRAELNKITFAPRSITELSTKETEEKISKFCAEKLFSDTEEVLAKRIDMYKHEK